MLASAGSVRHDRRYVVVIDMNPASVRACTVEAQANSFRGLFWGCLVSSALWVAVLFVGIKAGGWIIQVL